MPLITSSTDPSEREMNTCRPPRAAANPSERTDLSAEPALSFSCTPHQTQGQLVPMRSSSSAYRERSTPPHWRPTIGLRSQLLPTRWSLRSAMVQRRLPVLLLSDSLRADLIFDVYSYAAHIVVSSAWCFCKGSSWISGSREPWTGS